MKINVSYNGKPFYIYPFLIDINTLLIQKNHCPDVGLYYLFNNGEIVYIGASKHNIQGRILSHLNDKIFDSYFIFTCKDENDLINNELLNKCILSEAYLIKQLTPKYNSLNGVALNRIR